MLCVAEGEPILRIIGVRTRTAIKSGISGVDRRTCHWVADCGGGGGCIRWATRPGLCHEDNLPIAKGLRTVRCGRQSGKVTKGDTSYNS